MSNNRNYKMENLEEAVNNYEDDFDFTPIFEPNIYVSTCQISIADILKGVNAIVMKKRRITEGQGYKGACVVYNREEKKPEIKILFDIARCPFIGKRGGLNGNINPAIANKVGKSSTIDLSKMFDLFNGKLFYVDGVSRVKHVSDQGILALKVDPAIALLTIHGYDTSIEDVGMVDLDNETFYTHPHSSRCEDMILQYDLVYTAGIEKITIRYNNKQQNKKNKPKYVGSMAM